MSTLDSAGDTSEAKLADDVGKFFTFGSHSPKVAGFSTLVSVAVRLTPDDRSVPDRVAGVVLHALRTLYDPSTDPVENQRWRLAFGLDADGFQKTATERKRLAYQLEPKPAPAFATWQNGIGDVKRHVAKTIVAMFRARVEVEPHHPLRPNEVSGGSETLHNLPAAGVYLDRRRQIEAVEGALVGASERFVLIKGPAGIGKTRLAREIARRAVDSKLGLDFDFVFEMTAKDRAWQSVGEVLDRLGLFLGSTAVAQASEESEKRRLLRTEIGPRRGLLILDNVETVPEPVVRSAMSISDQLRILLTSRELLAFEFPVATVEVEPLDDADVRELMEKQAGRSDVVSSELVVAAGGSPLAALWVGGRLQLGIPAASLEKRFKSADGAVFEDLFADNWRDASDDQKRALMVVSKLAASVSYALLARTLGVPATDGEDAVAELVRSSLLELTYRDGQARVSAHPLARAYAGRRLDDADGPLRIEILESLDRALGEFCRERNELQLGRTEYDLIGNEVESVIARLRENLLDSKERHPLYTVAAELVDATSVYLWRRGRWEERVAFADAIASLHLEQGAYLAAARQLASAGIVRYWQGRHDEAQAFAQRAQEAVARADSSGLAKSVVARLDALIAHGQGDSQAALIKMISVLDTIREADVSREDVRSAIGLFSDWPCAGDSGFRSGEVALLQEIGIIYADTEDAASARLWLGRSIDLARDIGDQEGEAVALSHRGRADLESDPAHAREDFRSALRLAESVGRRSTEGRALLGLAQTAEDAAEVASCARRAAVVFRQLGMVRELKVCESVLRSVE